MNKRLVIDLPEEIIEELDRWAKSEHRSRVAQIRLLIEQAVRPRLHPEEESPQ